MFLLVVLGIACNCCMFWGMDSHNFSYISVWVTTPPRMCCSVLCASLAPKGSEGYVHWGQHWSSARELRLSCAFLCSTCSSVLRGLCLRVPINRDLFRVGSTGVCRWRWGGIVARCCRPFDHASNHVFVSSIAQSMLLEWHAKGEGFVDSMS